MADEQQQQEQKPERDFETEARESGWRPQAEYRGNPEKWITAQEWVERGESFIPFLQTSNRELKSQLADRDSKMMEMDRQLKMASKAIEELKEMGTEQAVSSIETEREGLLDQIQQAHEAGDLRLELKLRDKYSELGEELRAKKNPPAKAAERSEQTPSAQRPNFTHEDPEFKAWVEVNPWFKEDYALAGAAISMMGHMNGDPEFRALTPRQRLDRVSAEIAKRFLGNQRRSSPGKVEGGGRSDGSGGTGGAPRGKGFEDLPQDARAQCDALSKRFVGKVDGRGQIRYKDLAAYRAAYVKDYFAEDWGTRQQASVQ